MGAGWAEAVFLDYQRSSNCYIVATERGVESTRSLYRQQMQQRWSPAAVARIKATPWTEREKHSLDVHFNEPPEAPGDPAPREAPTAPRRMRINKSDLETHGYTANCQQCEHTRRYGTSKPGGNHTAACRKRLSEAIGGSEVGRQRIEAYDDRLNRAMAEQIEHADKEKSGMVPPPPRGDEDRHAREPSRPTNGGREVLGGAPDGSTARPEPLRPDTDQRGVSGGMGLPTDEAQTAETPLRFPGDVVQRFRTQAAAQRE